MVASVGDRPWRPAWTRSGRPFDSSVKGDPPTGRFTWPEVCRAIRRARRLQTPRLLSAGGRGVAHIVAVVRRGSRASRLAWIGVPVAVFVVVVVLVARASSAGKPPTAAPPPASAAGTASSAAGTVAAPPTVKVTSTTLEVTVLAGAVPVPPAGLAVPDPRLTPGAVLVGVTSIQVCTAGFASAVRDVGQSERDAVFAEYGITVHSGVTYEVDHLVSLELGGSNDIANLWPEPQPSAGDKDRVENLLHREVCDGTITLAAAQEAIRHWWTVPAESAPAAGTTASPGPGGSAGGPIARCKDGTYSYAAQHEGACSHHGGVAEFYR